MAELVEIGNNFNTYLHLVLNDSCRAYGVDYDKIEGLAQFLTIDITYRFAYLGMHYLEGLTDDQKVIQYIMHGVAQKKFPVLLAMTNNLAEFSSIPTNDKTEKTYSQNSNTFSMSENQPVDATETITTPYIKVNGKNGYKSTETEIHETVHEYAERQKISEKTVYSLAAFLEEVASSVVYEYNYAW